MKDQMKGSVSKDLTTMAHRVSLPRLTFRMVGFFCIFVVLILISFFMPSDVSADLTVLTGIINNYWPGNASLSAGAMSITLGAARNTTTTIAIGDLVLIIQMQNADINSTNTDSIGDGVSGVPGSGSTNLRDTGRYEYAIANSAVGTGAGTLNLQLGLLNSYTISPTNGIHGQWTFQVVRVPIYWQAQLGTPTATAETWNGATGGIVAFDAQNFLNLNSGTINVSGQGFHSGGGVRLVGGAGAVSGDYRYAETTANANATTPIGGHDTKGEGIAGTPTFLPNGTTFLTTGSGYPNGDMGMGAPGNAGGGGSDPDAATTTGGPPQNGKKDNTGGGGGANGGTGGRGGWAWSIGNNTVAAPRGSGVQGGSQVALGQVTLSWTTASEVNTAGFNLYRSERPGGPYIRINPQLIPVSSDALVGGKYQYVDTTVAPGQTYYYQLEDVELNGTSTRHEPISVTVASASGWAANAPVLIGFGIAALALAGVGFGVLRKRFRVA